MDIFRQIAMIISPTSIKALYTSVREKFFKTPCIFVNKPDASLSIENMAKTTKYVISIISLLFSAPNLNIKGS